MVGPERSGRDHLFVEPATASTKQPHSSNSLSVASLSERHQAELHRCREALDARSILMTRAVDNRMKKFFLTGEVEFEGKDCGARVFGHWARSDHAAGLRLNVGASVSVLAGKVISSLHSFEISASR